MTNFLQVTTFDPLIVNQTGGSSGVTSLNGARGDLTLTADALGAVSQGQVHLDLGKQPGVDTTGASDCGAAVQSALDSAASTGVRVFARGTIKTSTTLTIKGSVDLSDLTVNYTGTGVAIQVGPGTSGAPFYRNVIKLPQLVNVSKTVTGWAQTGVVGTVGVLIINAYACTIDVPHIQNFETGLRLKGVGTGCVYNVIRVGHLDNNRINENHTADATGWCNDNTMIGGFRHHESTEGTNVAGTRQILIDSTTSQINMSRWYGGSVEGDTAEYHLDCSGTANLFNGVRWEVTGGGRVRWGVGAASNTIDRGYNAHLIVETFDAAVGSGNVIVSRTTRHRSAPGAAGVIVYENSSSSANPVDIVMDAGAASAGTSTATGYRISRSASATGMKAAADAADRIKFDHTNGRVYLGNGTGAPVGFLSGTLSALLVNAVPLSPAANGTLDLGLSSLKWRNGLFTGYVQVGAVATASRPTASSAGAGAHMFDTTLNKPIWSNGTNWVDATGATV